MAANCHKRKATEPDIKKVKKVKVESEPNLGLLKQEEGVSTALIEEAKMLSCAFCSFATSSGKLLKNHMVKEHDEREFACEVCGLTIRGRFKMQMHKNSHRKFTCKNCEKVIPYNSHSSHTSKCFAEKSFKCEKCDKVFNRKHNLKCHIEMKRCEMTCNHCGKTLKSSAFLDKHMASQHQAQISLVKTSEGHIGLFQSDSNDLKCTSCEFVAVARSKLKRHMKTHNPKIAKAVHKCTKCDSTFKYKSGLARHIVTPHRTIYRGTSRASYYRRMKKLRNLELCSEGDIRAVEIDSEPKPIHPPFSTKSEFTEEEEKLVDPKWKAAATVKLASTAANIVPTKPVARVSVMAGWFPMIARLTMQDWVEPHKKFIK